MLNPTFGFGPMNPVNPTKSGTQKQPTPEDMARAIRNELNRVFYPVMLKPVVEESNSGEAGELFDVGNTGENLGFGTEGVSGPNLSFPDSVFPSVPILVNEPGEYALRDFFPRETPEPPCAPLRYPDFQDIQIVETLFKELSLDRNGIYIFEGRWGEVIIDPNTWEMESQLLDGRCVARLCNYGIAIVREIKGLSPKRAMERYHRCTLIPWHEALFENNQGGGPVPVQILQSPEDVYSNGCDLFEGLSFGSKLFVSDFFARRALEDCQATSESDQDFSTCNPEDVVDEEGEYEIKEVSLESEVSTNPSEGNQPGAGGEGDQPETGGEGNQPGAGGEGNQPETGGEGADNAKAENKEPEVPWFMRQDDEAIAYRQGFNAFEKTKEGAEDTTPPTKEEILAKDNAPLVPDQKETKSATEIMTGEDKVFQKTVDDFRERLTDYLVDPEKKFKLCAGVTLEELVKFMMCLNSQSAETRAGTFFKKGECVTNNEILAMRKQLKPEAIQFLHERFLKNLYEEESLRNLWWTLWGYTIIAVDGTCVNVPKNDDPNSVCKGAKGAVYHQYRCTTANDCLNGVMHLVDASGKKKSDERTALLGMLDKFPSWMTPLLLMDRGFEGWEVLVNLHRRGIKFVMRIKDASSNGILQSFDMKQAGDQFQALIRVTFYRPGHKHDVSTDDLKLGRFLDEDTDTYFMRLRVLQFRLPSGKLETLVTNVPDYELTALQLMKLYHKRWNVETSYFMLKYTCNLKFIHSKFAQYIQQELWAKFLLFNYASFLKTHAPLPPAKWKKGRKYEYAIKWSWALAQCVNHLEGSITAERVGAVIAKNLQPIRPNRNYKRDVRPQTVASFNGRGGA